MSDKHDITAKVERLEILEERFRINLESLFAETDFTTWVTINGVVRPREGNVLEQTISLILDLYDADGRLVVSETITSCVKENFFGFKSFSTTISSPACFCKVRIYPRDLFG
jgi:hypothetical protein